MRDPISVFKTESLERKGVTRNAWHGSCQDRTATRAECSFGWEQDVSSF